MPIQQPTTDLLPSIGALIIALTGFLTTAAAWLATRTAKNAKNSTIPMSSSQTIYTSSLALISKTFVDEITKITRERIDTEASLNSRVQTLEQQVDEHKQRLKSVEDQLSKEREEKATLIDERATLKRSIAILNAKMSYLRQVIENNGFKVSTEELKRIETQVDDEGDKA